MNQERAQRRAREAEILRMRKKAQDAQVEAIEARHNKAEVRRLRQRLEYVQRAATRLPSAEHPLVKNILEKARREAVAEYAKEIISRDLRDEPWGPLFMYAAKYVYENGTRFSVQEGLDDSFVEYMMENAFDGSIDVGLDFPEFHVRRKINRKELELARW